jgi:hypothetical protein
MSFLKKLKQWNEYALRFLTLQWVHFIAFGFLNAFVLGFIIVVTRLAGFQFKFGILEAISVVPSALLYNWGLKRFNQHLKDLRRERRKKLGIYDDGNS